jgi:pseudouridine synthase
MAQRVRIHKYIANCGYASRRRAELLVQAGRVQVNERTVSTLGMTIDPRRDSVMINGDLIKPPERATVLFHKPTGVITSTHDTHDRLTVMDLLPRRFRENGVVPVGRLDQNTEGLLLLTNDGDLNHQICHPSHEIEKEYLVEVEGHPSREALRRFETGIVIEGKKTAPAQVLAAEPTGNRCRVLAVITEGRKRQVRRMFDALRHPVTYLCRMRVGNLILGETPLGEWRALASDEAAGILK